MVAQIGQWALASDDGLHEESKHGEHGQSSVLQLLHLQLGECVGVVSQTQGIEGAAWVDWISNFTQWSSCNAIGLDRAHEYHLRGPNGKNALSMDQGRVAQVVQAAVREDLRTGLEPH